MKYCDTKCKYGDWPKDLMDGSKSCRSFIAIWCNKKKEIVYKNAPCIYKEEE
jgi:hypothetical protein